MLCAKFFSMGCQMTAMSAVDSATTRQAFDDLISQMATAEACFSRFVSDSELMILNHRRRMVVSDTLYQMLEQAMIMTDFTHGLISPAVGSALHAMGYRDSFSQLPTTITTADSSPIGHRSILLEPDTKQVTLADGVMVDLGGFAKLLTAATVSQAFYYTTQTPLLLDAGGDVVCLGDMTKMPWVVHLPTAQDISKSLNHSKWIARQLPIASSDDLAQLFAQGWRRYDHLASLAIDLPTTTILSTSGIDYRHWHANGQMYHHLIHPSHARSHSTDIINTSVLIIPNDSDDLHHSTNLAQSLSKLSCLLGTAQMLTWLVQHHLDHLGLSWIIHTPTGYQQWLNPAMQTVLDITSNKPFEQRP